MLRREKIAFGDDLNRFSAPTNRYNFLRGEKHLFYAFILIFLIGCSKRPAPQIPTTSAHQRLIDLCEADYNLEIVTKAFDNTLWVYLPLDDPFIRMTASRQGPVKPSTAQEKLAIKFIDAEFSDHAFQLRYDIALEKSYTSSNGIESQYSDELRAKQGYLLQAVARAYAEVEQKPGSNRYVEKVAGDVDFMGEKKNATHKELVHAYVKTEDVPDFFVMVIADIKTGIEMRTYLYLQDLRRATREAGFAEENGKRIITEQPIGHEIIIEDKKGAHLEARDLTWPEFLTKQIVHRVNFKYNQSSFPPSQDTRNELLKIVAETVQAYDFKDFDSVTLKDLDKNTVETISRSAVVQIDLTPPKPVGTLHHIKFMIGPPQEDNTAK